MNPTSSLSADPDDVQETETTPRPYLHRLPSAGHFGETLPLERATEWVRQNQYVAMVGVFALGVFLGILARR